MIGKQVYAGELPTKNFAGGWLSAPTATKPCDSCKASPARLFCRADSAFLCAACDGRVHGANKLASRHERVLLCEVCEQSPAIVTCKADAAALCAACDADIHSANPLARRHQRLPVAPFFHSPSVDDDSSSIFDEVDVEKETESAPWLLPTLLPNPKIEEFNPGEFFFADVDPYLDLEYDTPLEHKLVAMDSIVPVQTNSATYFDASTHDYHRQKPSEIFAAPSLCQTISSSSMEVAVVPDGTDTTAMSGGSVAAASQLTGVEREARVMRYREKRKNRKFEKTIRYASRKAYAETRPRIKGRFAKRVSGDGDDQLIFSGVDIAGYGVVPSF